ncbi:hypothetical protein GGR62_002893 [Xanthomonas campestris]|nr:hypothetical protein [Xanthomonas sp. 3075]
MINDTERQIGELCRALARDDMAAVGGLAHALQCRRADVVEIDAGWTDAHGEQGRSAIFARRAQLFFPYVPVVHRIA